jgi:thiamine biosynthesis lipoprotein
LHKLADGVTLDLGGIGKGFAVDAAIQALRAQGAESGWVNAGGDLRVFGPLSLPIDLRDEEQGGVRRFATLGDGAFATSRLAPHGPAARGACHASVAAPTCLWADALTKVVIASGDSAHPLVGRLGAQAWLH